MISIKHGHCPLIHGPSMFFVYCGSSNMWPKTWTRHVSKGSDHVLYTSINDFSGSRADISSKNGKQFWNCVEYVGLWHITAARRICRQKSVGFRILPYIYHGNHFISIIWDLRLILPLFFQSIILKKILYQNVYVHSATSTCTHLNFESILRWSPKWGSDIMSMTCTLFRLCVLAEVVGDHSLGSHWDRRRFKSYLWCRHAVVCWI